jgi:Arc/MetJ-type ribon-helix-helix transcriptional regulator
MGFDMNPKVVNVIRSIRILNELDKWNPGDIWGNKEKGSVWNALGIGNASNRRGSRYSPDSSQTARNIGLAVGKLSNYDPENSKFFYDKDTEERQKEYKSAINNALRNGQTDMAKDILKEMAQFLQEREGKKNKDIEGYNLMGDRYFEDLARNMSAESERDVVRDKMKEQIKEGLRTNNTEMIRDAMRLEPEYGKDALTNAIKEHRSGELTEEQKKAQYEFEQAKKNYKLQPFYQP